MVNRGDSFHDCWANIGTLIQMRDSIQSAIAARVFDCGYIEAAHGRVEEMRTSPADALEPPTMDFPTLTNESRRARENLTRVWGFL